MASERSLRAHRTAVHAVRSLQFPKCLDIDFKHQWHHMSIIILYLQQMNWKYTEQMEQQSLYLIHTSQNTSTGF